MSLKIPVIRRCLSIGSSPKAMLLKSGNKNEKENIR
jgi:hypothetical protein